MTTKTRTPKQTTRRLTSPRSGQAGSGVSVTTETIGDLEYTLRSGHRPGVLKRPQAIFMAILVLLDVASVWFGYYVGWWITARDPRNIIGPYTEFWPMPAATAAALLITFFWQRMYQRRRPVSHLDEFLKITLYATFSFLITVAMIALLLRDFDYHRQMLVIAWLATILTLAIARMIHAQVQWQAQARGVGDDRVLVIGAGEIGQMLMTKIKQNPKLGYQIVGVVEHGRGENGRADLSRQDTGRTGGERGKRTFPLDAPILGTLADIPRIIDKYSIDEVFVGLPESSHQELVNIISLCEREKVGIRVFPDVFQIMASEVSIDDLGGLPLLTIRDVALQGWKLTLKRGLDVFGSAFGLIMLSPFMLLAAVLIKLDSPGPVFYTQERMGLDARPFKIIKFRTMRMDAEEAGPGWTTPDDPRKTKLGTMLRRFNIDELPQLINVLLGDMSLVGPRPERPVYVEQFRQSIPRYMDRHREKAGLTGWAQVNGMRGDTSIAERTKYDLWYIENWSLWLDIKIILRTLLQTVVGDSTNAY